MTSDIREVFENLTKTMAEVSSLYKELSAIGAQAINFYGVENITVFDSEQCWTAAEKTNTLLEEMLRDKDYILETADVEILRSRLQDYTSILENGKHVRERLRSLVPITGPNPTEIIH